MIKNYRKIGGHTGSALLSLGAGISQGDIEENKIWAIDTPIMYGYMGEYFISGVILG